MNTTKDDHSEARVSVADNHEFIAYAAAGTVFSLSVLGFGYLDGSLVILLWLLIAFVALGLIGVVFGPLVAFWDLIAETKLAGALAGLWLGLLIASLTITCWYMW